MRAELLLSGFMLVMTTWGCQAMQEIAATPVLFNPLPTSTITAQIIEIIATAPAVNSFLLPTENPPLALMPLSNVTALPPNTDTPTATAPTATAPTATVPTATLTASLIPTQPPTATETATVTVTASPTNSQDWRFVFNTTEQGQHVRGNPDAPITLTSYTDFICPACQRYVLETEPHIVEQFVKNGQVRLVSSPFLGYGGRSFLAQQAVECTTDQAQFWKFRQFLFEHQADLAETDIVSALIRLAGEFGLEQTAFNACLLTQAQLNLVDSQDRLHLERNITELPSFEVNNTVLVGEQPFPIFAATFEQLLTTPGGP